jgi:hypothetical protein
MTFGGLPLLAPIAEVVDLMGERHKPLYRSATPKMPDDCLCTIEALIAIALGCMRWHFSK